MNNIDLERLLNLEQLDFNSVLSEKTGEISTKRIASYHFCQILVYDSGLVMFKGSIHKLWNSLNNIEAPNKCLKLHKGFNGNLFTLADVIQIRQHLCDLFNARPSSMCFQNIELGVNTTTTFDPNLFIKGLLYHKNIGFEYKYNNSLAQALHQRFIFKIYNKSKQYGMKTPTLRVELKIRKIAELNGMGLKTFDDINRKTIINATEFLLKRFREVVNYDYTINPTNLTSNQKDLLKVYANPRYWINDLKPNHRDRHKKRLKELIFNNSDNLHHIVLEEIKRKCVIINQEPETKKCVINNQEHETAKCVIINPSSIGINITQHHPRICPVTGADISMQKRDSQLLSNTGLKYYEKNDSKFFNFLLNTLLTGNYNAYENSIYAMISKQIRNKFYSNGYNHNPSQTLLFDTTIQHSEH